MSRSCFVLLFAFVLVLGLFSPTSATPPPAKIVTGVVSNVVSAFLKWIWSLSVKSTSKPVQHHSRSMVKFESGYTVETIFDGSKLGIEPHSVRISPNGEFLVLDSENSNIYKISGQMSRYSRPKLLAGSPEGYIGHIDGRPRDARMNHPKGLAVDDRGNIYIADTLNMVIRKISDEGVTTIAGGGGKWSHVGGHVDGPSEDAKFSNDFDLVYVGSSCALLVVDRGNHAIREIQLHQDDCTTYDEYDSSFQLGVLVLIAAGFFGYMLALLHWRVRAMFSSPNEPRDPPRKKPPAFATQQMQSPAPSKSVRPPLIPNEDEYEKQNEGFFVSLGRLFLNSGSCMTEILGGLFSGSKRKPIPIQYHNQYHHQYANRHSNASWPMQESFVIPHEDEPPSIETRTPPPRDTYPIITKEAEKLPQHFNTSNYLKRWDGNNNINDYEENQHHQQKHRQLHQHHHKVQHHHQQVQARYSSTPPQSYYEQNCETNEIVFGAVQEHDGRREAMVIKAVDYGDPKYSNHNIRPRLNYVGYSQGY